MGGGTRLKIIEAMMAELPVVSSSIGAEGLDVRHEAHLLVGDTPEAFARHSIMLLRDSALRRQLAGAARSVACRGYSWQSLGERYAQFCHAIARRHRAGRS